MVKVKNYTDSINVNLVFAGDEKDIKLATGYEQIANKNLMCAITHLAAENNDHVNYTNIDEMIKAKASGVTMMGGQFLIHGVSSISESNGALIVVNNMVTDINALRSMPIQNIKSINVLKGAAASIYGSLGGNGVIIITLKN
jgi:TonB-dependent SusC/RagA subfamily outer membrane receptor|tara:strand:+ start:27845 stop:28270 length:426 start_codon:yes stop_codon:yes gene_type:complete